MTVIFPLQVLVDTKLHTEAKNLNILYDYNGTTYTGLYLNEDVVYPDYSKPEISKFIDLLYRLITQYITIPIDGLILKDNWPSDENFHMNGSDFEYFTKVSTLYLFDAFFFKPFYK